MLPLWWGSYLSILSHWPEIQPTLTCSSINHVSYFGAEFVHMASAFLDAKNHYDLVFGPNFGGRVQVFAPTTCICLSVITGLLLDLAMGAGPRMNVWGNKDIQLLRNYPHHFTIFRKYWDPRKRKYNLIIRSQWFGLPNIIIVSALVAVLGVYELGDNNLIIDL